MPAHCTTWLGFVLCAWCRVWSIACTCVELRLSFSLRAAILVGIFYRFGVFTNIFEENAPVKWGSHKVQASTVRRWLHELEPMNHLENLGSPRSLCLFPTNPKPENIRCKINTDHPTHPAYACSSFLFYNLCRKENAASALPHSAPAQGGSN